MSEPSSPPVTFLVIDFNADSRYLLVKTLQRRYPQAVIREADHADLAIQVARTQALGAVIAHRTYDVSGCDLVRAIRNVDPAVPIIMVSGIDREKIALEAGANAFLHYDEWLRIATVVEPHLKRCRDDADGRPPADQVA